MSCIVLWYILLNRASAPTSAAGSPAGCMQYVSDWWNLKTNSGRTPTPTQSDAFVNIRLIYSNNKPFEAPFEV